MTGSNDLFDDVQNDFVRIDDLDGRNVLIYPHEVTTQVGNDGRPYDKVIADVVVLDGEATELIEKTPTVVEAMHFSSMGLVPKLKTKLRKADGRPLAGKIDSRPSKANKRVLAFGIQPWGTDDPIRQVANEQAKAYSESKPKDELPF